MANIARFHRKKLPSKKALKITGLDEKTNDTIAILSTFLRFAEKLDRSHCWACKEGGICQSQQRSSVLSFYSDSDCSFEEWSIIQNQQAFYEAFEKQLDVKCIVSPNA